MCGPRLLGIVGICTVVLVLVGCTALIPHTVSTPDRPAARDGTVPVRGTVGQLMFFRVVGAVCSRGHRVEYQLDWGGGKLSAWADLEVWVNSWDRPGTFPVKARARSVQNPAVVSAWSEALTVLIEARRDLRPPAWLHGTWDMVTEMGFEFTATTVYMFTPGTRLNLGEMARLAGGADEVITDTLYSFTITMEGSYITYEFRKVSATVATFTMRTPAGEVGPSRLHKR